MAEAAKKSTNRFKKWPRKARGGGTKTCGVAGCKRPYRAKGYCFFHYKKWRREELEGRPARWIACSKPECKKKVSEHGLCKEHFEAWKKARKKNQVAAAAAAPAA